LKEIKFKTFPPLFPIFGFLSSISPEQTLCYRLEEEGYPEFYGHFQWQLMASSAPIDPFKGAGDGATRPWKCNLYGAGQLLQ
jgi:hypothetical protein